MKTLHLSILSISACILVMVMIQSVSAQVAPVLGLPHAFFKSDHTVYPIQYNLTNAILLGNPLDLPAKALLFTFNATGDGQLTVELPRKIIDSTRNGVDKPYFVSLGDVNAPPNRIVANEIRNNNESRILVIHFTKGEQQVEIVGTYFIENNSTSRIINLWTYLPPLAQFQRGIDSPDVTCKQGFQLILKAEDGSPACVKPTSIKKLVSLQWALKPADEITVEDFKDTYKAGEKIDFTMKFKGLYTCGFPSSTVKDTENKTIWESPIVLTLCDPDTGYGEWKWKFADLYTLILNQTGSYRMNISFSDKTLEKEFVIFDPQYTLHLDKTTSQESNISQSNLLPTIHPPKCEYYPNNTTCHGMTTWVDNQIRDYDESQVYDYINRSVEMDNVTFLYTGSSTPEKDNLNCDTEFPRAINVTFGHHPPIVVYDGYYKVNETRHFTVTLADGTINSTSLCWAQFTKPKIIEMIDDRGLGVPIYSGMKINWLDKNKTAAIVQHQYQTDENYYNEYIAEVRK